MKFKLKIYLGFIFLSYLLLLNYLFINHITDVSYLEIIFFIGILFITKNITLFFISFAEIATTFILPILFPIISFCGPFWTAVIAFFGSISIKFRNNTFIWYKLLFNLTVFSISASIASLVYNYVYTLYPKEFALSFLAATITYSILNNSLVYIVIKLSTNNTDNMSQYFIHLAKNILFSYFLGLILYYIYISFGKILFVLTIAFILIIKDIIYSRIEQLNTEETLKKTKEELKYTKLKNIFFRNISHEFKTPLNLIFSALKMLEIKDKNNENEKYIKIIKQNSYRLLRLVNNLIDITRIDTGSFNLNLQNVNIVEIVKNITLSVKDYVEENNKILSFNTSTSKKILACDPDMIERILLNLLSNAIKFTDEGDKISVSISLEENKNVIISVKDSGIGIEKEKQKNIFKPFGQITESISRNQEGSGLGLSIVKSLVKLHNGEILLNSEEGKGSEFIVKLPVNTINESNSTNKIQDRYLNLIETELSDIIY